MALAYQARAMLRGLAKLGEASSLAGVNCGPVCLERDVTIDAGIGDTADDNPVVRYTVASLAAKPEHVDYLLGLPVPTTTSAYRPRVGQSLVHPDGTFRLDRLLDDNGVVRRFIVTGA